MKAIKFSRNELRVIQACITMTGGNEINEFITDSPRLTETQTFTMAGSITKKINDALSNPKIQPNVPKTDLLTKLKNS